MDSATVVPIRAWFGGEEYVGSVKHGNILYFNIRKMPPGLIHLKAMLDTAEIDPFKGHKIDLSFEHNDENEFITFNTSSKSPVEFNVDFLMPLDKELLKVLKDGNVSIILVQIPKSEWRDFCRYQNDVYDSVSEYPNLPIKMPINSEECARFFRKVIRGLS